MLLLPPWMDLVRWSISLYKQGLRFHEVEHKSGSMCCCILFLEIFHALALKSELKHSVWRLASWDGHMWAFINRSWSSFMFHHLLHKVSYY
jgi:hypothetical protein